MKSKIAELIRRILENNLLDEDVETISFRGWEAAAVVAVFTKGVSDLSLSENSRTKGSGPVSYDTTYILYDIVGPNDQSFGQMFVEQDLGSSPQVCSIAQSMKKTFDIYQ